MRWIQKIGRSRRRRTSGSWWRRLERNGRPAARRQHEPAAGDRSYAAYLASWEELEWEPVWVFAPNSDREFEPQEKTSRPAPARRPDRRDPGFWRRLRLRRSGTGISRIGALLLAIGSLTAALALTPIVPSLSGSIRAGLIAAAAVAYLGCVVVGRTEGDPFEPG